MSPGSLVHVGGQRSDPARFTLTLYDEAALTEESLGLEALPATLEREGGVAWLDLVGIHDVEALKTISELMRVHPLVMEDIANTQQRPKLEFHDNLIFGVVRLASPVNLEGEERLEQVSFLLGKGCLVTLREGPGPLFDPVRQRLKVAGGRLRRFGADYLLYALLDVIVDHYFVALEELSQKIERLEAELIRSQEPESLIGVHEARRHAALLKRAAWPLREVVTALTREESCFTTDELGPYLRDLSDHVLQVVEIIEVERETLSGYMDLYVSLAGNKMNRIMAFLTVIATIFIPLTFIVGVYGMNFENMPELHWRYGYAVIWVVMVGSGALMALWFRKQRWL